MYKKSTVIQSLVKYQVHVDGGFENHVNQSPIHAHVEDSMKLKKIYQITCGVQLTTQRLLIIVDDQT